MLYFGKPVWVYVLMIFCGIGGGALALFCRSDWRKIRSKRAKVLAILSGTHAIVALWIAHTVGYRWFHAIDVDPGDAVIVAYAWPKNHVAFPVAAIEKIGVYRMDRPEGGPPSPRVEIFLRNGETIGSCAPLPSSTALDAELASLPATRVVSDAEHEWTFYFPEETEKNTMELEP